MNFVTDNYLKLIGSYPRTVIFISALFGLFIILGLPDIRQTNDYRYFFTDENPYLAAFEELERTYSSLDTVMFVYKMKDGSKITSQEGIKFTRELTTEGWQIPYSTRVDSITNFQNTRSIGQDDIEVRDLVPTNTPLDDRFLNSVEATIQNEPLIANRLLSSDTLTAAVVVSVVPPKDNPTSASEIALKSRLLISTLLAKYPNFQIELTGSQMVSVAFSEASQRDLRTLLPVMFFLIAAFLVITTRTLSGTLSTLVVIALSAAGGMGFSGWAGIPMSPPSSFAPIIIMIVAVADCVHILISALVERGRGLAKQEAIIESLKLNAQPVFLTSVTTAIGLFSLNFSDSPPFQDLGTVSGVGALLAWVFSITLFPALLMLSPLKISSSVNAQSQYMVLFADWVIENKTVLLVASLLVTVTLASLIPRLTHNDKFLEYFDERIDFRKATDWTSQNLSGVNVVNYSISSKGPGGISDPEYLSYLADYSSWLRDQPEVDHVASFSDIMKRINKSMNGDLTEFYAVPSDRDLAAQYLLLYEMSLPYGLDLNNQINVDKSSSRLLVTTQNLSTSEFAKFQDKAWNWMTKNTPEYMHALPSGGPIMFAYIGKRNLDAMITGTLVAYLLISGCLVIALRSFRLGMVSLIPNMAPPLVAFGIFAIFYSEVGFWTSFVAATAIGLIVDATVHILSKYRYSRVVLGQDAENSVRYSFATVGTALWISSVVLIFGFLVLWNSPFLIMAMLGLIVSITILAALVLDFILLPTFLVALDSQKQKS
ncbi:MAG: RND family transporter [Rhizobiales bacterium TMED83]|jgi:predicted RND superfamily exporter protein|nr:RND transporter [Rhodobiaceae bacterium]RPF94321.1 MAG: RND family transporter [Rhizobiales bacterium TMED83]